MIAREVISPLEGNGPETNRRSIPADTPLISVLPLLLDSGSRELTVEEEGHALGVINQTSLLEGLGRMIAARDDCSVITMECTPGEYSASHIARAVEDADVHLVDLLSVPAADGNLQVLLRVRCDDPSAVVSSLERYGYTVTEVSANNYSREEAAYERLLEMINIYK